jgi:hypothetical protein
VASRIITLRRKLATGQYELTHHAKEEMEQDRFVLEDVKQAIYSGRISRTQQDKRGKKHTIAGIATNGRGIRVVCRMTSLGRLRIITVYERGNQ